MLLFRPILFSPVDQSSLYYIPTGNDMSVQSISTSRPPRVVLIAALVSTMTSNSTGNSHSIFKYELKSGIYKIQNLLSQTYMDIHEHTREVCCRPATALAEGKGLVRPRCRSRLFVYLMVDSGESTLLVPGILYRG